MSDTHLLLSEEEQAALDSIAHRLGRTPDQLIREALVQLISRYRIADRRRALQQARGVWKDRTDLPDWGSLRRELDRHSAE